MFPILKTDYFYLWFLYKSDSCISCFRNDGSLEITHVFHLSIITSYNKKYFKISLLPLNKKVSLKKLQSILESIQCIYIFDIIIYNTILSILWKYRYFKETFPSLFFTSWSLHHNIKREWLMSPLKKIT